MLFPSLLCIDIVGVKLLIAGVLCVYVLVTVAVLLLMRWCELCVWLLLVCVCWSACVVLFVCWFDLMCWVRCGGVCCVVLSFMLCVVVVVFVA